MSVRLLAPLLLLALLAGCATQKLSLRPEPRAFTPSDYDRVYDAWTRDADDFAFGRLQEVLHVTATFESWEFRWAYVVRYASDMSLGPEARADMLRATLQDAERHHRFFVTMVGPKFRESDLTSERSAWRVLLVDDTGRTTIPVEIDEVRKPGATERMYFPSVSPFRHTFRISFPAKRPDGTPTIPPDSDYVLLRFTGVLGTVDLRWELAQGGGAGQDSAGGEAPLEARRGAGATL